MSITRPDLGGYVVGNFGICAQVIEAETITLRLLANPPELGEWLRFAGEAEIRVEDAAGSPGDRGPSERVFPEYRTGIRSPLGELEVRAFAPLGGDPEIGFLPVVVVKFASAVPWRIRVSFRADDLASSFLAVDGSATDAVVTTTADAHEVAAEVGPGSPLRIALGVFDARGRYADRYPDAEQLARGVLARAEDLGRELETFIHDLPRVGDPKIDEYIRWYSSASILLTKGLRTGEVLTMGYRELNQRDSFWASAPHLYLWPGLEKQMILETVDGQHESGRIPSTILPTIDRGDEIDSSEYFILRVARYHRWHRDRALLSQCWDAVKGALAYLASRDLDGVGVPKQTSFWADWKDVPGVEGREYAPHFALLLLAVLDAAIELGSELGDPIVDDLVVRRGRADEFVNRHVDDGGMWDGTAYVDRWEDGRRTGALLQDQVVGLYFDVIPHQRVTSVLARLQASESPYGVRDTSPYLDDFAQPHGEGGNYHNGGVWLYLNFVDAAARYRHGAGADAERIVRKVGHYDLEAVGDFQPGEFLNAEDGRNLGMDIQAWDSALLLAIYGGAFGADRPSEHEVVLTVRLPDRRDFRSRVVLPAGRGTLASADGVLSWEGDESAEYAVTVVDGRPG